MYTKIKLCKLVSGILILCVYTQTVLGADKKIFDDLLTNPLYTTEKLSANKKLSKTYLLYKSSDSYSIVAAVNANSGITKIEKIVGFATASSNGDLLPVVSTPRGDRFFAEGMLLGALPSETLEIVLDKSFFRTSTFQLSSEKYQKALDFLNQTATDVRYFNKQDEKFNDKRCNLLKTISKGLADKTEIALDTSSTFGVNPECRLIKLDILNSVTNTNFWKNLNDLSIDLPRSINIVFTKKDKIEVLSVSDNNQSVKVNFAQPKIFDNVILTSYVGPSSENKANGVGTLYYATDKGAINRAFTANFDNGYMDGIVIGQTQDAITERGYFVKGKKHGLWTQFDFDNVIVSSESFSNGLKSEGPVIFGNIMNSPMFGKRETGVVYQFVGFRNSLGELKGEKIPVIRETTTPDGYHWIFNGDTLFVDGHGSKASFKLDSDDYMNLVPHGRCVRSTAQWTIEGVCNRTYNADGGCKRTYIDGRNLTGTCKNGLFNGTGYLTGPGIDNQYVNFNPDGSYSYNTPGWFDRTVDSIGNVLEDVWRLSVDPETYFNPNVWEDTMLRLLAEGTRVIERSETLMQALETFCGPDTNGCTFAEGEFSQIGTSTSSAQDPGDIFTRTISRSPSSEKPNITIDTKLAYSYQPTVKMDFKTKANNLIKNGAFIGVLLGLNEIESDLIKYRKVWEKNLDEGEIVHYDCLFNGAGINRCIKATAGAGLSSTAPIGFAWRRYSALGPVYPETMESKIRWETEMRQTIDALMQENELINEIEIENIYLLN